nr:hypothetical protein DM860_015545 [Ipomoea trifida]GMD27925.1 major pollen allergen Ole E 6-like [Ipomoea batatas]
MSGGGQMRKMVAAVFLIWLVALSGMDAKKDMSGQSKVYKQCFETCQNDCMQGGRTYTDCEMKCDTDCSAAENQAKLGEF